MEINRCWFQKPFKCCLLGFWQCQSNTGKDWTINSRASSLQIYLEGGRHLSGGTFARTNGRIPGNKNGDRNHKNTFNKDIKLCIVPDIKTVGVTTEEQAQRLLAKSARHRYSAVTGFNNWILRSHSVRYFHIIGRNASTGNFAVVCSVWLTWHAQSVWPSIVWKVAGFEKLASSTRVYQLQVISSHCWQIARNKCHSAFRSVLTYDKAR